MFYVSKDDRLALGPIYLRAGAPLTTTLAGVWRSQMRVADSDEFGNQKPAIVDRVLRLDSKGRGWVEDQETGTGRKGERWHTYNWKAEQSDLFACEGYCDLGGAEQPYRLLDGRVLAHARDVYCRVPDVPGPHADAPFW